MISRIFSVFSDSEASFEGKEADEKVLLLLRRHLFVILFPLAGFALLCLVPPIAIILLAQTIVKFGILSVCLFVSSLYYLGLWLAILKFLTMYTLNTITITDRRIIDRDQHGFFNHKDSELHTSRIQDVTVQTRGVFETMLHFGDIIVQTAASEKQFTFRQMPNPEQVKNTIMQIIATSGADRTDGTGVHN